MKLKNRPGKKILFVLVVFGTMLSTTFVACFKSTRINWKILTKNSQSRVLSMKSVAVIGSGAVGCYYGARLAEGNHDVTFQMRRDLQAVKQNGLSVQSCLGDMFLENPKVAATAEEIGPVDWVLVCLKSYALKEAKDLIAPCVGENTRILMIMNGLAIEEPIAEWFGAEKVFGGLAFICANRGVPGQVIHSDYGALDVGHFLDDPSELDQVKELFAPTKVEARIQDCLLAARWGKLLWNIPFNGISVAMGGVRTDQIMNDPDLRSLALKVMMDVRDSGNLDLKAQGKQTQIGMDKVELLMQLTDDMEPYKTSTMLDFVEGRPLEIEYMYSKPLERAQALNGNPAYMEFLIKMVRAADRKRQLTE
mmetsp:Transcript_1094/g.1431  ORF Transcript_1094/g.1431 Transcript_1094/m.1431 type:complete len:364 (-) Transcript_1094:372-1463(-)|eukprot:CAMPEP_0117761758 /NCGR_PEP_ID=MMETSP0947-20121206/17478_1 /TAXON_ID=44440 /ORGANISM="Chattonella subsalsa, Strain CCMP2191" /LENGTH=363 /DNA_ID=CAMNT_0005582825 /DNA_START=127 /DNA_END=1218 /DNA_ORIENTATION=+